MQSISLDIISEARKAKMQELELSLKKELIGISNHEMFICPLCHYQNSNGRGSAKFFQDENGKSFKCFSCGVWRRI